MDLLDRDVKWTGGRSARELIALAGGVGLCSFEVLRAGGPDLGNFIVYVLATLAFATRVYFARAAAVGACVGAIAQQWPHLRFGLERADLETLAVFPLIAIALLASSDLVERFDRNTTRHTWLPNHWAPFSAQQTRTIRWTIYTAGALGGLLDHILQLSRWSDAAPWWPRAAMIAIVVCAGLLVLGRAVGLLGLWLTTIAVALLMAPQAWIAERLFAGEEVADALRLFRGAEHYVTPAFLLATATALISTPFVLRLLRGVLVADTDADPTPS